MSFSAKNDLAGEGLLAAANNALRDGVVAIDGRNEEVLRNWSLKPDSRVVKKIRRDLMGRLAADASLTKK